MHALAEWLESRTGCGTACRCFLLEDIPNSAGWAQVFGSVAAFLVLLQTLTGGLLALNYAPTPGDAYSSLRYIIRDVAAGRMIHGLHHWGASLMIIVVFVHMAQVFLYGAYRKPREATWIAGAILLLLTLAFALTGYLLPWDNRAYWGTMVTTRIMASVPFFGSILMRLVGAANGIGVVTFSRFYALHTLLLPALMGVLVILHISLVRRHGITPAVPDEPHDQKFYPRQAFRDVVAVFTAFAALFIAAAFLDVPLERLADPTDTTYVPRPEWYFLFLFQLLKMFDGALEVIGTVVLPSLAVILLFSVPFLPGRRLRFLDGKAPAIATVLAAFTGWAALTAAAIFSSPGQPHPADVSPEELRWAQIAPEEIAGIGYFYSSRCDSCHNLLAGNPKLGPNLAAASLHHPKEWLAHHFRRPTAETIVENNLSLPELNSLSLFIANLSPDSAAVLKEVSPQFIKGAQAFVAGACGSCHKVNGIGGGIGPPLNGLADRRSKDWVIAHFQSPQKLSPGSIMPSYRFSREDRDALILYLFSLPE